MVFVIVKDMQMWPGQKLIVRGNVKNACERFHINIGQDIENLGLHMDCRYNYGDQRTILCNSRDGGNWADETKYHKFPFQLGEDFQITINFNNEQFFIKLPDGEMLTFPNLHHSTSFTYIDVQGDAEIHSFEIKTV